MLWNWPPPKVFSFTQYLNNKLNRLQICICHKIVENNKTINISILTMKEHSRTSACSFDRYLRNESRSLYTKQQFLTIETKTGEFLYRSKMMDFAVQKSNWRLCQNNMRLYFVFHYSLFILKTILLSKVHHCFIHTVSTQCYKSCCKSA